MLLESKRAAGSPKPGGFDLHPFGFDSFGLPAENAAIRHNIHPKGWTDENIAAFTRTCKKLAFAWADWANGSSPRLRVAVTAASTATPALRIPGIPCLMQPPEALGGCSSVSTD